MRSVAKKPARTATAKLATKPLAVKVALMVALRAVANALLAVRVAANAPLAKMMQRKLTHCHST